MDRLLIYNIVYVARYAALTTVLTRLDPARTIVCNAICVQKQQV
jgi:hypothetical protein